MEPNELETFDSSNEELEILDSSNEIEADDEENTEDDKPEYTEREKQYYARIKKLEEELRDAKKGEKPKKESKTSSELSTLDIIALSKANIEDEDIDEVLEYASYKKIPVREALKSSILKSTLAEKAEMRKSAQAVNTGSTRRSSSSVSDDRLLADARKGIMPESEEDIARLTRLKLQKK
jgi:hypothetical protein